MMSKAMMHTRAWWLSLGLAGCSSASTTAPAPPTDDAPSESASPSQGAGETRPPGVIYRNEVDAVTSAGPAVFLRNVAPEPVREQGKFAGWKITAVFPEFPGLCGPGCDLQPGDVIVSVNGDSLATPDAFAALFETLPKLDTLHVVRIRDGEREEVTYTIVPAP